MPEAGVVVFVHCDAIAAVVEQAGFTTLVVSADASIGSAIDGLRTRFADLAVGLCGGGAGAAKVLAADCDVDAIVAIGGRPDLADATLPRVRAPTLFVAGGRDRRGLELGLRALRRMTAPAALHVVPDAGEQLDSDDAVRDVVEVVTLWFARYLGSGVAVPAHDR